MRWVPMCGAVFLWELFRRSTPDFSLAAIGLVAFGAALILNRGGNGYEVGTEILNAGASCGAAPESAVE